MRFAFVGAVDFSGHCLNELLALDANVVVVFNPSREHESNSDYADLPDIAATRAVPLVRFRRIGDPETVACIRSFRPDVLFVLGLSQTVPPSVLAIPSIGCIGSLPTLLPRHRGRHPLIWTLAEGLRKSGLTLFFLDEHVDSGDIVWQQPFPVTLEDTATLYERVKQEASVALRELVSRFAAGTLTRIPQRMVSRPKPFPRSPSAVRALARVRGAAVGVEFAEAFMLLREVR